MKKTYLLFLSIIFLTIGYSQNKALIIGINHYMYMPASNNLKGCENDANSFKDLIQKNDPSVQLEILFSDKATRDNILNRMNSFLEKCKSGEKFFFFYSGHGTNTNPHYNSSQSETKDYHVAICPTDVRKGDNNVVYNLIFDNDLTENFKNFRLKGVDVISIFDCCNSGTLAKDLNDDFQIKYLDLGTISNAPKYQIDNPFINNRGLNQEDEENSKSLENYGNLICLGACKDNESAIECEGNGVFTKILVNNFSTNIFLDDFYKTVYNGVQSYTSNRFHKSQSPTLYISRNYLTDFSLLPLEIKIKGLVTDIYNEPISNATIGILKPGKSFNKQSTKDTYLVLAKTNENGSFELSGRMFEGRYNIKVVKDGYRKIEQKLAIKKGNSREPALRITLTEEN